MLEYPELGMEAIWKIEVRERARGRGGEEGEEGKREEGERECCLLVHNLVTSHRSENTLVRGGVGTQFSNLCTAVNTPAEAE